MSSRLSVDNATWHSDTVLRMHRQAVPVPWGTPSVCTKTKFDEIKFSFEFYQESVSARTKLESVLDEQIR